MLAALAETNPDLDVWAIADALWLGTMAGDELGSTDPADSSSPEQQAPANSVTHAPKPAVEEVDELVAGSLRQRLPGSRDKVPGHEIVVRPPQAFTASQMFARALQPLTRPWLHGTRRRVDIDATVDAYASSGILSPVMKPEPERWFDLVVIIDTTSSMAVWRKEITAFTALLRGIGAFRNTHVWQLNPVSASLGDKRGRIDNPARRVATPGGRRLVMLLSDFASAGWRAAPAWQLVHTLATTTPTVLVDPLPPHLWSYSGLDSPTTVVHAAVPGARSSALRFHLSLALQALEPDGTWLPIPFAGFTAPGIAQWAKALMRAAPEGCDAILLNLDWIAESASVSLAEKPVADRVEAFLHTASPSAARLAVLCSPFPHFSLPLLDLIRHTVMRDADLSDVAEFLVSGLLETSSPGPDQPVLSFHGGAAEQLRAHLTYHDAWHTFDAITRHIAAAPQATNLAFGLSAVVVDPNSTTLVTADTHPFAEAASSLQHLLTRQHHSVTQPAETPRTQQQQDTRSPRVYISYVHESLNHDDLVLRFASFLVDEYGIDVVLDRWSAADRMDWEKWATREITNADFVIVIVSPKYGHQRRTTHEFRLILEHTDPRRILQVILAGSQDERISDEFPNSFRININKLTYAGVAPLLERIDPRLLARRPQPRTDRTIRHARSSDLAILSDNFGDEGFFTDRLTRQDQGRGALLVAWQNDRPIGHIYIWLEPSDTPEVREYIPGVPLLSHVEVHPDYRSRGVGTELIATAEQMLRDDGFNEVALAAQIDDRIAGRLFRRLGYSDRQHPPIEVMRDVRLPDGTRKRQSVSCLVMIKRLRADPVADFDRLLALPSVHLIVDGGNVAVVGYRELPATGQREHLLQQLAWLATETSAEVTVVFSGAGVVSVPDKAPRGVRALFSDPGVVVEDVIHALVAPEPESRPVAVVTSDSNVAVSAVRSGADHVRAETLLAWLDRR